MQARWARQPCGLRIQHVKLLEAENSEDLGQKAAELVLRQLRAKPRSLITLATGNTPLPMFRELVAASKSQHHLFESALFVTLDEYADIGYDDRRRLLNWLRREFLEPAVIRDNQILAFDARGDHWADCQRIEGAIATLGGLDLAVLGLGPNGHIGFNEPGSAFDSVTRKVPLAPESIVSNASYWGTSADVPSHALTLGLGTLKRAKSIVLLVSGAGKAEILSRLINEPVSESLPASLLRLCPQSILIADRQALLGLREGTTR
jgi:glucosamine-6-phosphate deaminase